MKSFTLKKHLILAIIIGSFWSCSNTSSPSQSLLKIEIENNTADKAALIGYLGDKQIIIDTLSIIENKISYDISSKCNTGLYSIVFTNDIAFEFIYNDNNIDITFNQKEFPKSLKAANSKENSFYFSFYNDISNYYQSINNTDSLTKENSIKYSEIFNKYLNSKEAKGTNAYKLIEFLYQPDYTIFKLVNPNIEISENEFMLNKYITHKNFSEPFLYTTPYLYLTISNYLNYFKDKGNDTTIEAINNLYTKSYKDIKTEKFVEKAIHQTFFKKESLHIIKNDLKNKYSDDIIIRNVDDSTLSSFKYIETDTYLPISDSSNTNKYKLYIFIDSSLKMHNIIKDIDTALFQYSTIENVLKANIANIICYPTILITDKDNYLLSRWYGFNSIKNILKKEDSHQL